MPRGNGTGPNGMGPMTGRGAGFCAGFESPGFATSGAGQGMGRGGKGLGLRRGAGGARGMALGRGQGRVVYGPGYQQQPPVVTRKELLEEQLARVKDNAQGIEKQLEQLESEEDQ